MAEIGMTNWHCETCGSSGLITYDKDAGVYECIDLLRNDHTVVARGRGGCSFDLAKFRVELVEVKA